MCCDTQINFKWLNTALITVCPLLIIVSPSCLQSLSCLSILKDLERRAQPFLFCVRAAVQTWTPGRLKTKDRMDNDPPLEGHKEHGKFRLSFLMLLLVLDHIQTQTNKKQTPCGHRPLACPEALSFPPTGSHINSPLLLLCKDAPDTYKPMHLSPYKRTQQCKAASPTQTHLGASITGFRGNDTHCDTIKVSGIISNFCICKTYLQINALNLSNNVCDCMCSD